MLCARHIGATIVRRAASGMSGISNTTFAPSTIGLSRLSVIDTAGSPARHEFRKHPHDVAIVGLEADGNQRVPRCCGHRLLLDSAPRTIEQRHAAAERFLFVSGGKVAQHPTFGSLLAQPEVRSYLGALAP